MGLASIYRCDGVVVRASASQSLDLGFNSLVESYQKTSKIVFTASLLRTQQLGEVVENKPTSLLVVSLGKALNGTPPPLRGRQVAHTSEMATFKRVQTSRPKYSETIRFLVNGGYIRQIKKT